MTDFVDFAVKKALRFRPSWAFIREQEKKRGEADIEFLLKDIENEFSDLFSTEKENHFEIVFTMGDGFSNPCYIDYIITSRPSFGGEYSKFRKLYPAEVAKAIELFRPFTDTELTAEDFRVVEYGYHTLSEPDDCFDAYNDSLYPNIFLELEMMKNE